MERVFDQIFVSLTISSCAKYLDVHFLLWDGIPDRNAGIRWGRYDPRQFLEIKLFCIRKAQELSLSGKLLRLVIRIYN